MIIENNETEIWRPIKGFPHLEMSNIGRIRDKFTSNIYKDLEIWKVIEYKDVIKNKYMVSTNGNVANIASAHILAQCPSEKGYLMVLLRTNTSRGCKSIKVHRIVATTFCEGQSEECCEVNHIDGNKNNNHAYNLEWISHLDNIRHAYKNNLVKIMRGEDNGRAKISNAVAEQVSRLLVKYNMDCAKVYYRLKEMGIECKLDWIHSIKYKKTHKFISDKYF